LDTHHKMEVIKIKLNSDRATIPIRGSKHAAGYDLFASESVIVNAGTRKLVKTDLTIEQFPENTYGRIAPRSGLSIKNSIDVGAGVIDPDYRGDINIILINNGKDAFEIKNGMRIAQLICERCSYPEIMQVSELSKTERGSDGFGSSGI